MIFAEISLCRFKNPFFHPPLPPKFSLDPSLARSRLQQNWLRYNNTHHSTQQHNISLQTRRAPFTPELPTFLRIRCVNAAATQWVGNRTQRLATVSREEPVKIKGSWQPRLLHLYGVCNYIVPTTTPPHDHWYHVTTCSHCWLILTHQTHCWYVSQSSDFKEL